LCEADGFRETRFGVAELTALAGFPFDVDDKGRAALLRAALSFLR
jgi:hypothetical protein